MATPGNKIICYDGRTLAVDVYLPGQVEARRGRRWKWFGQKGWWIRLRLKRGWQIKKFVPTLSEAGVFLKHDPDYLPWIEEEESSSLSSEATPADPTSWAEEAPFWHF